MFKHLEKRAKNYFCVYGVGIILLVPISVSAQVPDEQAVLQALQQQIQLLILEVHKLEQSLRGVSIREPSQWLEPQELREIIRNGVNWFKNAQEENGHMRYEFVPYDDVYLNDDNIVRQAGSLYALGEIALYDTENKYDLKETLEKQIAFFENQSTVGSVDGMSFRCVANSLFNSGCQLGATSLALVGLLDFVERFPETKLQYEALIDDYARYHVAMKKEGAGFRNTFVDGGDLTDKESSFSNGEALLALVRYYRFKPTEEVRQILEDTFTYFESDEVEFDFPLYLWVMAAMKDFEGIVSKERIVTYVNDYTLWRVNGFLYRKGSTHNMCAYTEGIVSALSVVEGKIEKTNEELFRNEILYWHDHMTSLQTKENDTFRIVTNDEGVPRFGEMKRPSLGAGGFLTNHNTPTQRIDYTQHCLNSYLQQLVLLDGEEV